jgi:hypothetical protein
LQSGRRAVKLDRMASRNWTALLIAVLITVLTLVVSRKLGFTLLLLPLFFVWGHKNR